MGRRGWLLVTMALVLVPANACASGRDYFTLRCECRQKLINDKGQLKADQPYTAIITIDLSSMFYEEQGAEKKRIKRVTNEMIYLDDTDVSRATINRATGDYVRMADDSGGALIGIIGTCRKIDLIPFGARKF